MKYLALAVVLFAVSAQANEVYTDRYSSSHSVDVLDGSLPTLHDVYVTSESEILFAINSAGYHNTMLYRSGEGVWTYTTQSFLDSKQYRGTVYIF